MMTPNGSECLQVQHLFVAARHLGREGQLEESADKMLLAIELEPWARRILVDLSEVHTAMGKFHEAVSPLLAILTTQ